MGSVFIHSDVHRSGWPWKGRANGRAALPGWADWAWEEVRDRRCVFVARFELAAGWGTTDIDPVGCTAVTRAAEALGLAKGLARDGPQVAATLPVVRGDDARGERAGARRGTRVQGRIKQRA